MSHTSDTGIGPILKSLAITALKLLALAISFTCKIAGLILTKIGELFEKLSGHENH